MANLPINELSNIINSVFSVNRIIILGHRLNYNNVSFKRAKALSVGGFFPAVLAPKNHSRQALKFGNILF